MRTVEDYWEDFEHFGFIKHLKDGRRDYILDEEKGSGGFSILGDTETAVATISDYTLYRPLVIKADNVNERIIELGQYYTGLASYMKKKKSLANLNTGLMPMSILLVFTDIRGLNLMYGLSI